MTLASFLSSPWIIPILAWSIAWKGIALWKAGRHNQLPWFIVLLIVNTLGILEIIYIYFLQPKNEKYVELKKKR
ncbi:MAG: DUF5652 family protein [Nanoarchaeota archaeon]